MLILKRNGIVLLLLLSVNTTLVLAQSTKNSVLVNLKNSFSVEQNSISIQTPLYTSYQANTPALPFYSYTTKIPNQGNYSIRITFTDSVLINNMSFEHSKGLEKKAQTISYFDTSYYIGVYNAHLFFPKADFQTFTPVVGRDVRLQTFHIYPFKYLATQKQLKVYTQFKIELEKISEKGENEITNLRNFTTTQNLYAPKTFQAKYEAIGEKGELLIVYRNTAETLIQKFAHWKQQVGFKTHLLKLDENTVFPEDIKQHIAHYYDSIPDLLYMLLVGDFVEIPSYLYKQFLNDDYYSDTYYTFLDGNDFVPELFVGRFSGTELENETQINKTIFYERYQNADNYERNVMLIGSDQGTTIGDDNERDWEHLRNIGIYLADSVGLTQSEYFDGSQGGLDADGNPNFTDIKDGVKNGNGFLFYTGHGDFSLMNTGNFFTMHAKQLENYDQLPIVISVACNHGKYIDLDCMAEVFQTTTKNNQFTGSVAFTGSTILMSWAPPMETQDEFAQLMNPNNSKYKSTLGAAFYNAQLSMLEKYPTIYGEEVMQTWLLFGDPTLKMRINQKGAIYANLPDYIIEKQHDLTFSITENDCFVSLSQNDEVIATTISQNNEVRFENLHLNAYDNLEIVATKSNYRTFSETLKVVPFNSNPFTVFPNPTNADLNIVGIYPIDFIEIIDVSGRKISNFTENSKNSYNLDQLSAGVYTVLIHANNAIYAVKIIKTNEY
ncbi:MAG TPA: C25 family cysteine peptidase [Crocinitomicaceae bacterium]|nr:C25 family cysteine peptidase [Crocinitomicaceae bacterium]